MLPCLPLWKACNQQVDFVDKRHCNLLAVPEDVLRLNHTLEELLLDANQISELPRAFFRLMQLRKLTLSDNEISSLPPEIANFMHLQELDVSRNDIEDVPDNIRFCKNLQIVDFSSNPLQRLPEGFTHLKNLTNLALNDVSLTRLPTDIGSLTNLECLELRENLIKYLPTSLSLLTRLKVLDLGSNMIDELPDFIGSLHSLEELWLDCNDLLEIPREIGNLRNLTQLDLSENKLESLPAEIGNLVRLTDLVLSQNCIQYLPDTIGNLTRLTILKLDQNRLQHLNPCIGNCDSLQELLLTENMLTELSPSLGRLRMLTIFNVDRNKLSSIPKEMGNCVRMGVLSLRDNCVGHLPHELGNMKELHVLDVCGNRLQHLPFSLSSCNLKAVWLSENQVQPLLKFQQDFDETTGQKILTCFLLPQQNYLGDGSLREASSILLGPDGWMRGGDSTVKFAGEDRDSFTVEESHFVRHNTPHPKELRARHSKYLRKESAALAINSSLDNFNSHAQKKQMDLRTSRELLLEDGCGSPIQDKVELQPSDITVNHPYPVVMAFYGHTKSSKQQQQHQQQQQQKSHQMDRGKKSSPVYQAASGQESVQPNQHLLTLGGDVRGNNGETEEDENDERCPAGVVYSHVEMQMKKNENDEEADEVSETFPDPIMIRQPVQHVLSRQLGTCESFESWSGDAGDVIQSASSGMRVTSSSTQCRCSNSTTDVSPTSSSSSTNQQPALIRYSPTQQQQQPPEQQQHQQSQFLSLDLTRQFVSDRHEEESDRDQREQREQQAEHDQQQNETDVSTVVSKVFLDDDVRLPIDDVITRDLPPPPPPLPPLSPPRLPPPIPPERHHYQQHAQQHAQQQQQQQHQQQEQQQQQQQPQMVMMMIPPSCASKGETIVVRSAENDMVIEERILEVWVHRKSGVPLGMSIAGGVGSNSTAAKLDGVYLSRVCQGGPSDVAQLRPGDRLISVNGVPIDTMEHNEVVRLLKEAGNDVCLLIARPVLESDNEAYQTLTVKLTRDENGLGFTIAGGRGSTPYKANDQSLYISRISKGGAAELEGSLRVGDKLISVNGIDVRNAMHDEAVRLLTGIAGPILLIVTRPVDRNNMALSLDLDNLSLPERETYLTPILPQSVHPSSSPERSQEDEDILSPDRSQDVDESFTISSAEARHVQHFQHQQRQQHQQQPDHHHHHHQHHHFEQQCQHQCPYQERMEGSQMVTKDSNHNVVFIREEQHARSQSYFVCEEQSSAGVEPEKREFYGHHHHHHHCQCFDPYQRPSQSQLSALVEEDFVVIRGTIEQVTSQVAPQVAPQDGRGFETSSPHFEPGQNIDNNNDSG